MNELHSNIDARLAINAVALGATGTITGSIIDRAGYGGVEFVIGYGSVVTTGTVATVVVKEGDVTGTLTSVADADLIGTEALASLLAGARTAGTGKECTKRIGYKGTKRYVQASIIGSGTTSVGYVWADAVLFHPEIAAVANP